MIFALLQESFKTCCFFHRTHLRIGQSGSQVDMKFL